MRIKEVKSEIERIIVENPVSYVAIGTVLPGWFQERFAEKHKKKKIHYCYWSLGAAALYTAVRFYCGEQTENTGINIPVLNLPVSDFFRYYGYAGVVLNTLRVGLIAAKNKPYGDLVLGEVFGRLALKIFGKPTRKMKKVLDKHNMGHLVEEYKTRNHNNQNSKNE